MCVGCPGGSVVKNPLASAGDPGTNPGLRKPPGEGSSNTPLQYSCLENPMDGGAWCRLWGHTESDTTEVT